MSPAIAATRQDASERRLSAPSAERGRWIMTPLIDNTLAELINQAADGHITKEHLRRFLANPDRVLPEDSLKVKERLLFLVPKDQLGFERAVYEDGKLMYVPPWDGWWRIAVNGKIVAGSHEIIYGDDGSVVGAAEDYRPTFAEGSVLYAYLAPDGYWWMRWGEGMTPLGAYCLYDKPVMQPIVIAGKPACVIRSRDDLWYVRHGGDTYGPHYWVDPESLCAVSGGIGYAARDGDRMSVFVNGHRVNFPAIGTDRWDEIRDLHCRQDPPEGCIFPDLFSFIVLREEESRGRVCSVVVHGICCVHTEHEVSDLTIEEGPSGTENVLYVDHDPAGPVVCLKGGRYRSVSCTEVREPSVREGKPSFIKRIGRETAVWARKGEYGGLYHEESKPYDAVIGLKMVDDKPLFIARDGDAVNGRWFVVYDEIESHVQVSDLDHIRDYAVVGGQILQIVFDSEIGDDCVHFGDRKSRSYDRVFGFEVKEDGRVEFCAQRGRRILICSFDPKTLERKEMNR